jgi:hypothetical protein
VTWKFSSIEGVGAGALLKRVYTCDMPVVGPARSNGAASLAVRQVSTQYREPAPGRHPPGRVRQENPAGIIKLCRNKQMGFYNRKAL